MTGKIDHLSQNRFGDNRIDVDGIDIDGKKQNMTFGFEITCDVDFDSKIGLQLEKRVYIGQERGFIEIRIKIDFIGDQTKSKTVKKIEF